MGGWGLWTKLPTAVAQEVFKKLPGLAILAEKGRLYDSEIEAPFEGLIEFDESTLKADNCAINHSRCLWTNHPVVMAAQVVRMSELELESIRKEDAKKLRLLRKENSNQAREQNALIAIGDLPQDDDPNRPQGAALPRPSQGIKYSNPTCSTKGSNVARKAWTGCRIKKCRSLFCLSPESKIMSDSHQRISGQTTRITAIRSPGHIGFVSFELKLALKRGIFGDLAGRMASITATRPDGQWPLAVFFFEVWPNGRQFGSGHHRI